MQPQAAAARRLSVAILVGCAAACAPSPAPSVAVVQIPPTPPASSARPRARKTDGRIREIASGTFEVESVLFDSLIEAPSEVAPGVWVEPVEEEGKPIGYRLNGIKPGGVLFRLGLMDDDIIEIVNGESAKSERAIEAARASARRTGQVTAVLRRNGFQRLMIYRLVY